MIPLPSHSDHRTLLASRVKSRRFAEPSERFAVRFPDGEYPVQCWGMKAEERAFVARYLRDISRLISDYPQRWIDWREMLDDESCPMIEFDPEWFSFLLPPKSLTRMELFAWYWLWIEPGRKLAVSRYAFSELSAAFHIARQPPEVWDHLSATVAKANEALLSGNDSSLASVIADGFRDDPRERLDGSLIWFPRLIVDHEPVEVSGPLMSGKPEITVWGYLTSGGNGFDRVNGQILARRMNGKWTLDPRPARIYQPAHLAGDLEARRAFSD